MKTGIFIPSKSRVGKMMTHKSIPEEWRKRTYLIVPDEEAVAYKAAYPKVSILSPVVTGIGPTRGWIMAYAKENRIGKVVMLDDDLTFAKRREDDPTKFRIMEWPEDYTALFQAIVEELDTYAHVSVLSREGGNRVTEPRRYNSRPLRVLAYRTRDYFDAGCSFTRLKFMEDFDVCLQLLRAGKPNSIICDYVSNQGSSNAPGGCSTYRTLEGQAEAARGLAELHPGFVKVVEKTTKSAWNGATRTDVIIAWKKAHGL